MIEVGEGSSEFRVQSSEPACQPDRVVLAGMTKSGRFRVHSSGGAECL